MVGIDEDLAEPVALALVEGEGDEEVVPLAIEIGDRGYDLEVGVAAIEVVAAQLLLVRRHAVRIVVVGAAQEAQIAAAARVDDVAQPLRRRMPRCR